MGVPLTRDCPDAGTLDAGTLACVLADAGPAPRCAAVTPDTSKAVCRTFEPETPVHWLDGGIPGPCEGIAYQDATYHYALEHYFVQTFDADGRRLSIGYVSNDGGIVGQVRYQYDKCGRLVYSEGPESRGVLQRVENDYGPDGLLALTVLEDGWSCEARSYAYRTRTAPPARAGGTRPIIVC